jgi:thiol-disulfide isomerase/thioredoxin
MQTWNDPMNAIRLSACALLLALAACKQPAGDAPQATPAPAPATETTREAPQPKPEIPSLKLATVDGKPYDLAAHRGKWVVVNFWATWCAPCLKEMPELSALDAMREHIEVIGLAYEDIEPVAMQSFLKQHPVVYPVAVIDTFEPPKDFATPRGLPMTYLIAPDGKVARQFLGPITAHEIESAIAAAGGPAAPAAAAAGESEVACPDTAQHYRDKYVSSHDKRDLACHRQALEREARLERGTQS